MARPDEPRRRFAPVPIETTFESLRHRKTNQTQGPAAELTPEPSPRSPSPVPRELLPTRKFAPQLVETSRRVRRVGDTGPATKPADKTDITPYTNHIYVQRSKSRRRLAEDQGTTLQPAPTRRESEDEDVSTYLLNIAAREAERQIEEAALAAFPNSRAREGGVAHFYFREGSDDEASLEGTPPVVGQPLRPGYQPRVPRRKSSDLGWWHKAMQEHAEQLAVDRGEEPHDEGSQDSDSELDNVSLSGPPDPIWLTNKRHVTKESTIGSYPGDRGPIGESHMPLIQSEPFVIGENNMDYIPPSSPVSRPIGESFMPYIPSAPAGKAGAMPYAPASQILPETGFRNQGGGFGRPLGGYGYKRDGDTELRKMRNAASPPMLGDDLRFRSCLSPKQTKLEPDHPFADLLASDEQNRDITEQSGLWRGYCYRNDSKGSPMISPLLHGPPMIQTPVATTMHGDPFAAAFGQVDVSAEPESIVTPALTPSVAESLAEHCMRNGEPEGINMLSGIDERLQHDKVAAERVEKILAEFDDKFITQVYNYLSLGYPVIARAFDDELSKFSKMPVEHLTSEDEKTMAKGHILEMKLEGTPEGKRCPRWRALKVYICEWARQHPDLEALDPLAWGVRERRGSWAI
jgi:hypothetical protein